MAELDATLPTTNTWQVTKFGEGLSSSIMTTLQAATSGEHMIPLTPDKLREHSLGVTILSMGRVAGYTGITSEYVLTDAQGARHRALEVGGAVVMPEFRRRGLASAMLHKVIESVRENPDYPDGTRLVAFTNEHSRGYMEKAGMTPLAPGEQLSTDAFELCRDCTQCPIAGLKPWEDPSVCCDADGIRAIEL